MAHILKLSRLAVLCAALAALLALVGCGPAGPTPEQQAQQANRAYMSQVNEAMVELDGALDEFIDAVSRDDLVGMGIQSNNAKRIIDKLAAIEPPEVFADVHAKYVEGAQGLREALDEYVALYSAVSAAAEGESFDEVAFARRLAEVQSDYDAALQALREADEAVAGK